MIDLEWAQTTTQSQAFAAPPPLYLPDVINNTACQTRTQEELTIVKGWNEAELAGRIALSTVWEATRTILNLFPITYVSPMCRSSMQKPHDTWAQWWEYCALQKYIQRGLHSMTYAFEIRLSCTQSNTNSLHYCTTVQQTQQGSWTPSLQKHQQIQFQISEISDIESWERRNLKQGCRIQWGFI
jgi:hypothetical protein